MSVQIRRSSLQKLTHESVEIRLRAFDQISGKFRRALTFKQTIDFKPAELCKQLIRWFGFQPIPKPKDILEFLLDLLKSEYGEQTMDKIGSDRLKHELSKIQLLLRNNVESKPILEKILSEILDHQKNEEMETLIKDMESLNKDCGVTSSAAGDASSSIPSSKNKEQQSVEGKLDILEDCIEEDFESCLTKPLTLDYNILKSYCQILTDDGVKKPIVEEHLQHIMVTITDYPPDFLLQPPYIFFHMVETLKQSGGPNKPDVDITASAIVSYLLHLEYNLGTKYNCLGLMFVKSEEISEIKTQVKLNKALEILLNVTLMKLEELSSTVDKHFFSLLELMYRILEIYNMMKYVYEFNHLEKLKNIAFSFRTKLDYQDHIIVDRIKYLVLLNLLESMVETNILLRPSLDELHLLKPLLWDYAYQKNFPKNYQKLQKLFRHSCTTYAKEWEKFKIIEHSITVSISLLKRDQRMEYIDIINLGQALCEGIYRLKSLKLIEIIMRSIQEVNILSSTNPDTKNATLKILVNLVKIPSKPLKLFVFTKLLLTIKKNLSCMLDNEQYAPGVTNNQLLEADILGVPWNGELIQLIVFDGLENESEEIKASTYSIILILLKSRYVLKDNWFNFFNLLLPFLPILITYQDKEIKEALLEILNPDGDSASFLMKLIGNIVFLYQEDNIIRNEALTRLIYMIESMPDSNKYVPEIKEIQDIIPSNLFVQHVPRKLDHIINLNEEYTDFGTISSLLEILQADDIEPLIRKSTLLQLNAMCHNFNILETFCSSSAYFLILQVVESALKKNSFRDYKDSIIPALGILNKALLYDKKLRTELQNIPNIYMLLLRTLFLFISDIQVRQDASMSLFLLIFYNCIEVDFNSKVIYIPKIMNNLNAPFKCETKNISKILKQSMEEESVSYLQIFEKEEYLQEYLRHHIAACYSNDYFKIKRSFLENQMALDISKSYFLTATDCAILRSTITPANFKLFIHGMQNATDHASLLNACFLLKLQIYLDKEMPEEYMEEIFKALSKFLQLPPGDDKDYTLYADLLSIFLLCIRVDYKPFICHLSKALQTDFQHSLISLLKNACLPLGLYFRLCLTIQSLVESCHSFTETPQNGCSPPIFYANLFELFYELLTKFFEKRDLDRCRCLLSVLSAISKNQLALSDSSIMKYTVGLIKFSFSLKNLTQTGACWQRYCLETVCFIFQQISDPEETLKLNMKTLKYISGLCSHADKQVRSLAWTVLLTISGFLANVNNGLVQFLQELSFLPGGFLGCCIGTFLDHTEHIICRQISGSIFTFIFHKVLKYEESMKILSQHNFFCEAENMLATISFQRKLPLDFDFINAKVVTPPELLVYACRIMFHLCAQHPQFINDLCKKGFMAQLYELLKVPNAFTYPAGYVMCAEICKLYAFCNFNTIDFIQKTICRDQIWIQRYVDLLAISSKSDAELSNILQILSLITSYDNIAYQHICEAFDKNPKGLLHIFLRTFNIKHLDTLIQKSTLGLLNILLIKSQELVDIYFESAHNKELITFLSVLEKNLDKSFWDDIPERTKMSKNMCKTFESVSEAPLSSFSVQNYYEVYHEQPELIKNLVIDTIGGFCASELYRLFLHLYPTSVCKFKTGPTGSQVQVCDALGILLKYSAKARQTGDQLKLLDKIIKILQTFFEELNMPCTAFIRRYGDAKKITIVKNLEVLIGIILNWHTSPLVAILNEEHTHEITCLVYKLWPWMNHSAELRLNVLQMCAFTSDHSLIMCKSLATPIMSNPHSVLNMVIKFVTNETTNKNVSETNSYAIGIAIRILVNSCSCTEGRMSLIKARVLDIFNSIYPFNPKGAKPRTDIISGWLEFWEIFSRYPEGAVVRNLTCLCNVINKFIPNTASRLCSLRIIRNMAFLDQNRSVLFANTDFISTMDSIISNPLREGQKVDNYEEQLTVCVTIWKLISFGSKYISTLRGTVLLKKIKMLFEHLNGIKESDPDRFASTPYAPDAFGIIKIIIKILKG